MQSRTGDALDAMRHRICPCLAAGLLLAAAAAAQPMTSGATVPSGKLWHHDKNLVGQEGSAISDIGTGAYRALGAYRFPVPTRDGSRYLEERYGASERTTEIWIRRGTDGSVIDHLMVDGAITDVEFSPVNANLIRMNWGENALSYSTYAVYDLAARRVIWADDDRSRTQYTAWLPDGRLLGISSGGLLTAITTTGARQTTVLGNLSLRPNQRPLDLVVSPRGQQLLVDIADVDAQGRVLRHDYWLSSLDGRDPQQITAADGRASHPIFSPDGRFIAFRISYGTSDLVSACELRYVPISARNVSRPSREAREFLRMKDAADKVYPHGLGCELLAWLP